jgi:hypothetical protein
VFPRQYGTRKHGTVASWSFSLCSKRFFTILVEVPKAYLGG